MLLDIARSARIPSSRIPGILISSAAPLLIQLIRRGPRESGSPHGLQVSRLGTCAGVEGLREKLGYSRLIGDGFGSVVKYYWSLRSFGLRQAGVSCWSSGERPDFSVRVEFDLRTFINILIREIWAEGVI